MSRDEAVAAWNEESKNLSPEAQQGMLVGFMEWRGIRPYEEVCPHCNGTGNIMYGSTATWHGGVGGSAITADVCDKCWGSGSKTRPAVNLRELFKELHSLRQFKKKHDKADNGAA